jgi:hypothetical protein
MTFRTGKIALACALVALGAGGAMAQQYENTGSYEAWERSLGPDRYQPAAEPQGRYYGDARDDTILYAPDGRIVGTRDRYGVVRSTGDVIPEGSDPPYALSDRPLRPRAVLPDDDDDVSASPGARFDPRFENLALFYGFEDDWRARAMRDLASGAIDLDGNIRAPLSPRTARGSER